MIGGAAANQGEVLRYLAELPPCPDAILANRSLDWTVLDAKTIKVATGAGTARGEVTFELDEDGLIARDSAPSRIYAEANGRTSERPWRGPVLGLSAHARAADAHAGRSRLGAGRRRFHLLARANS